jgi:putative NADH-flavin reductase
MTDFTNTAARAAIISAIEIAHTKTRRTKSGRNPMRGALCEARGRSGLRRLTLVGGGPSVKIVPANTLNADNRDKICFYPASGVLAHEETATAEVLAWFDAQASRVEA